MTTLVLGVLAIMLAGPVPGFMADLATLRKAPRAAMVLWQAVTLAAVLSALGAGLSLATYTGVGPRHSLLEDTVAILAVTLTAVVMARFARSAAKVSTELRQLRRRHRHLVDVLAEDRAGVHVLEHETPTAYCLPGWHARVVMSTGTFEVLDESERAAVLEHERAHLRARHDLVLEAFTVLHHAFPALVTSQRALAEVKFLVEVLADRAARRQYGAVPLLRALSGLSGGAAPAASLGAASLGLSARLDLLNDDRPHRLLAAVQYLLAYAVLVLPTLLVALPWLCSL